MGKTLNAAITELAALKEGWSLQADTLPADFILDVADYIRELRARVEAAEAKLARLKECAELCVKGWGLTNRLAAAGIKREGWYGCSEPHVRADDVMRIINEGGE